MQLPEATRSVLLAAALTSQPSADPLGRSVPGADVDATLAEAERADMPTVRTGRRRFTHAILASAIHLPVLAGTAGPHLLTLSRDARRAGAQALPPVGGAGHLSLRTCGAPLDRQPWQRRVTR